MLMPAAVLIVLLLGAIAVDLSVVHLAHRELIDVAASAANDAATDGLDRDAFHRTGTYRLDPARATAAVQRSLDVHQVAGRATIVSIVQGPAADQVTVELRMSVSYVFAKALPGANTGTTVAAHATATAAQR
jgi:hypothetical protein